jgi:Skp family chaperone for outer membrane proteins
MAILKTVVSDGELRERRMKLKLIALVGIVLCCLSGFAEEGLKIGYVDINEVLSAYDKAMGISDIMKVEREKTAKEYIEREREIKEEDKKLREKFSLLSDKEKEKRKKSIQKKIHELVKFERARKEKEQEPVREALAAIYKAVETVGKREDFDIIIEKRQGLFGKMVLFAKESLDLTDTVRKELLKKQ